MDDNKDEGAVNNESEFQEFENKRICSANPSRIIF